MRIVTLMKSDGCADNIQPKAGEIQALSGFEYGSGPEGPAPIS